MIEKLSRNWIRVKGDYVNLDQVEFIDVSEDYFTLCLGSGKMVTTYDKEMTEKIEEVLRDPA